MKHRDKMLSIILYMGCLKRDSSLLFQVKRVGSGSPQDVSVLRRLNQLCAEFDPILSVGGGEEFLERNGHGSGVI